MKSNLRVGIVGGSVAGCVTATELSRIGCDVTLFERSTGSLEDRGAGILLALSLIETLKKRELVDDDMAHIPTLKRPFVVPDGENKYLGRIIWDQTASFGTTNWDVLYRQLRRRVPDDIYNPGCTVTWLDQKGAGGAELRLSDGREFQFDLVVCADGYESIGRAYLHPEQQPEYAGYILWRGLVGEGVVPNIEPFEGGLVTPVYEGGHAVCYLVPGKEGELDRGARRLNWAIYDKVSDKDLSGVMTDARGVVHRTSLPPGTASDAQVEYVHDLARRYFPGYVADAICATKEPFIQTIFDVGVNSYYEGRVCIIGDASTLARPHTGAGSVKAMTDAIALSEAIAENESLDAALDSWDEIQSAAGNRLVSLGRVLGEALVTDVPDWKSMTPTKMEEWFATVMSGQRWYAVDEAKGKGK